MISSPSPAAWVVMVPFPAHGHVTPMLRFARTLHSLYSIRSIIAVPSFIHHLTPTYDGGAVVFANITAVGKQQPDCSSSPDFFAIERWMEDHVPAQLEELVRSLDGGCSCLVVDLLASSAVEVGRRCGVPVVGFWPAMVATYKVVAAIPEMIRAGLVSVTGLPLDREARLEKAVHVHPNLRARDLPWLVGDESSQRRRFKFWLKILARSKSLECLIANALSAESEDDVNNHPTVLKLGSLTMPPTSIDRNWGNTDTDLTHWLSVQKPSSVVYVSFGTWAGPISEAEVHEMAAGLESSGRPFVWVLGQRGLLPRDYLEAVADRGKVVRWAPQVEVLRHAAVGGHLTHCGWNSTMESIWCGKKLLCWPIAGDQFVNCVHVVSVWRVGMRLAALERGAVEESVKRLLDDGEDMERRICRLRDRIGGDDDGAALRCFLSQTLNISIG